MARKKKTHENFVEEMKIINSNIIILGEYTGALNRIDCKCSICGNKWNPIANSLLIGNGCPVCRRVNQRLTTDEFKNKLSNDTYEIISDFNTYQNKVKCRCKICNYEWNGSPNSLKNGAGCPVCGGTIKKSHEQFYNQIKELINDEYTILEKYKNAHSKIKFQHNICHNIFEMEPSNFLQGQRCPICNKSKGEIKIKEIFILHNILFEPQKTFSNLFGLGNGLLSYDFYLPKYNLLIEYQGEFHDGKAKFSSNKKFIKQKEHDKRKKQYAIDNNIELLEIWYWDFKNIENILKEKLKLK